MRRPTPLIALATTTAVALALVAGPGLFAKEEKVPGGAKKAVEVAVAKLVGGEVSFEDRAGQELAFLQIESALSKKDKKGIAMRKPSFWVDAVIKGSFAKRDGARPKQMLTEKMPVTFLDNSHSEVEISVIGPGAYNKQNPHTLVVSVLPQGEDPKAWIEKNWMTNEAAKKKWVIVAVAESDKFAVSKQPYLLVHLLVHVRDMFNTDPNRWYIEGTGTTCAPVQQFATEVMSYGLAGIVLRNPEKALVNENTSLYSTLVVHDAETSEVGAKYVEISADRNASVQAATAADAPPEGSAATKISEWIEAHEGRRLLDSYTFETPTSEDRIENPFSGSLRVISPAKRGEPVKMSVQYDKVANKVEIEATNLGEFSLFMNDDLLNLALPVTIQVNGEELVTKKFERVLRNMFETMFELGEFGRVYPAEFRGFAPATVPADAGDGPGDPKEEGGTPPDEGDKK